MANTRAIRSRIRGVQNTAKITRAMEMIASSKMRKAQEKLERKLEAARRRQELKEQAMERRAQARSKGPRSFGWTSPASPPGKEPVSDQERLMILKMLEQKKITREEAEELLAALEGGE